MYARSTPERIVTLAVSGKLWNHSLVMVDQETGSLWSHLLGRAMSGPMKGTNLKTLPGLDDRLENVAADAPEDDGGHAFAHLERLSP